MFVGTGTQQGEAQQTVDIGPVLGSSAANGHDCWLTAHPAQRAELGAKSSHV